MPIYSYACPKCGHSQDHLMKMSDSAPACPQCQSRDYAKQVTAAAFALKGNGFYATDFKSPPCLPAGSSPDTPTACGGSCACHPS